MKNRTLVFTAGEKPDYTYTNQEIKALAESYSETNYSAPWVVGHNPKPGSPAAGWVRSLEYEESDGIGQVYAVSDFNVLGEECLTSGQYENKSVSFYLPDSPYNPTPGQWSLRHIAILGAEPPVLKDLGPIAVIEYSEDETEVDFVQYSCACEKMNDTKPGSEELSSQPNSLEDALMQIKELKDMLNKQMKEEITEEVSEVEQLKAELAQAMQKVAEANQELSASKEANMALTVSSAISPYYSEGAILEDVLPESTLTSVVTKLNLGLTNYSETETPLAVIEALLQVISSNTPAAPDYGETWEDKDIKGSKKVTYTSGDELHDLAVSTSKEYGLSYSQALSSVVEAEELSKAKAINFSECLTQTIKGHRK